MDFFGHRQAKAKQKLIALASPAPQMTDEEAKAVRDQTLSDGYPASEPLDDSDQAQRHDQTEVQAWEDVGLEHANEMGEQHADFTTSTVVMRTWKFPLALSQTSS